VSATQISNKNKTLKRLREVIEQELQQHQHDWIDLSESAEDHVERLDETRHIVQELAIQKSSIASEQGSKRTLAVGDLVLLRKAVLDNVKNQSDPLCDFSRCGLGFQSKNAASLRCIFAKC
jgi:hypothetical protein